MIICVASGKGGTGKTSVAVNLAVSLDNVQLIDCDVEEPNAHLFLRSELDKIESVSVDVPVVNRELCTNCGSCSRFCQFNAIFTTAEKILIFPELCHSCGGCATVCPAKAISWEKFGLGIIKFSSMEDIDLIYGELEIGKPMAVPIIKAAKKNIIKDKCVILDSPPGTSCPFVETVSGSTFCILVTEPTPFGLHDLKIAVQVLRTIDVPFGVIINRAGIGNTDVYDYCSKEKITILMEIPYQRRIAELYSQGIPFSLELPGWTEKFQELYDKIKVLSKK
ncbi:MAG: P-loop NTPase [Crenarchaeota archaeon]|nr:P-loop NTPase [Thermoproteota archaeon]